MRTRFARLLPVLLASFVIISLAAPTPILAQEGGLLATVRARHKLICGINGGLQGFGYIDPKNNTVSGFDADFCRVIAAAIFGDANAVDFKSVAAADRFTLIQSNEIDVLIRNTTYTFDRDTKQGADFGPTVFYDGQTVMVRTADKVSKLEDLKDFTLCAITGTTTEQNIREAMAAVNTKFKLVTFDTGEQVVDAFTSDRCDAVTSDRSQLASWKTGLKDPSVWTLFDDNLSKEPLTPAWKQGDAQWGDVVRWSIYVTILAEEDDLNSKNVEDKTTSSKNPEVRRLLGVDGNLNENLGLDKTWAANVIKQVGNYGEIFERNLGADTPLKLERGLNNLWTKGGLIYAPPYR